MPDILPFPSQCDSDSNGDTTIQLRYLQGGGDGRSSAVAFLSCGDNPDRHVVIPYSIIEELYRVSKELDTSKLTPDLDLWTQSISSDGPTETQLESLPKLVIQSEDVENQDLDDSVISFARAIRAKRGDSYKETIQGLERFSSSYHCPMLLKLFIQKVVDTALNGDPEEVTRRAALNSVRINAKLEYGTRAYTDPESRMKIGEVIDSFRGAFDTVLGLARGKMYHWDDIETFFMRSNIRVHKDARLKIPVPLTSDIDLATDIILEKLMGGPYLDRKRTEALIKAKITGDSELIVPEHGLYQITINAKDLASCGFPHKRIYG